MLNGSIRLHNEFTLSSEALGQLVLRLQSDHQDKLSALLRLLARSLFSDVTSALCFNHAAQYIVEHDLELLLELFTMVATYKPKSTAVLDECFAKYVNFFLFPQLTIIQSN